MRPKRTVQRRTLIFVAKEQPVTDLAVQASLVQVEDDRQTRLIVLSQLGRAIADERVCD